MSPLLFLCAHAHRFPSALPAYARELHLAVLRLKSVADAPRLKGGERGQKDVAHPAADAAHPVCMGRKGGIEAGVAAREGEPADAALLGKAAQHAEHRPAGDGGMLGMYPLVHLRRRGMIERGEVDEGRYESYLRIIDALRDRKPAYMRNRKSRG